MKSRRMVLCSVALLALACGLAISGAVGATAGPPASPLVMLEYTWTGLGNDDLFDHWCNWDTTGCPSEGVPPDGTDDNATIPASTDNPAVAWSIDLTGDTIGDLTLEESVNFGAGNVTPTLDVQKLVIDAASGEITLTIGESAEITITNP